MSSITLPRFHSPKADRIGVAASVLCAIHCGLAPVLLIFLPTFGKIWAHPASHALVAIFIVPLAILSIYSGYKKHLKRWILVMTAIGVLCVLIGAVLPVFTESSATTGAPSADQQSELSITASSSDCGGCSETVSECSSTESGCVDQCCPSAYINDSGELSLHIPPAAIVTTLGGVFLIIAHIGNLIACRRCECCSKIKAIS